jgi:hypothetical protein
VSEREREREREKKLKTRLINYKMKNKKNGIEWRRVRERYMSSNLPITCSLKNAACID